MKRSSSVDTTANITVKRPNTSVGDYSAIIDFQHFKNSVCKFRGRKTNGVMNWLGAIAAVRNVATHFDPIGEDETVKSCYPGSSGKSIFGNSDCNG